MPSYDAILFDPPAPVATVSLRNPQSRESVNGISMLIDSGADMSFIPGSTVVALSLPIIPGQGYKLKAVDGSSSVARAVQADMLFLGRTLRGRYLVRDSEIGILGRDVLNHFAILLDGPELNWGQKMSSTK